MKLINKNFLGPVSLLLLSAQGAAAQPAEALFPVPGEDGLAVIFDGAQPDLAINWASTPASEFNGNPFSKFVITRASSAYYFNSSGLLTEAVTNTPRYDHLPDSPFTPLGLLFEAGRTNRLLRSSEFDNAAWVKSNVTVTADNAAGPFGTTTADLLTATAANGTVIQDLGVVASAAKSGAVYIKRKTGTGNIDLTLDGGATWTTKAITSAWTRIDITQTLADEDFGIRIVTSGDEIWVEAADVQTGPFITSHIPTTTASVTRATEFISIATTLIPNDLSSVTLFMEHTNLQGILYTTFCTQLFWGTDLNNFVRLQAHAAFLYASRVQTGSAGAGNNIGSDTSPAMNATTKDAIGVTTNNGAWFRAGAQIGTDDTVVAMPLSADTIQLGAIAGGGQNTAAMRIKKMMWLPRRMTNADMATLTA